MIMVPDWMRELLSVAMILAAIILAEANSARRISKAFLSGYRAGFRRARCDGCEHAARFEAP